MTYSDPHSQYSHHYHPPQPRRSVRPGERPLRQQSHPPSQAVAAPYPYPSYPYAAPPNPRQSVARPPQPRLRPQPQRRRRRRPARSQDIVLAGGSIGMLALAVLAIAPRPMQEASKPSEKVVCQEKVESQSVLSRAELSELLTVAERASKESVREIIEAPFCTLSSIEVREGATAEREAYPLEFDPQTWFIVLYEEGEYAGFDFSFQRD